MPEKLFRRLAVMDGKFEMFVLPTVPKIIHLVTFSFPESNLLERI